MTQRVIAFVDHEIGHRLLEKLISLSSPSNFELVAAVTTKENGHMWWPGVEDVCVRHGIPLLRYSEPFLDILNFENIDWYFLLSWKHVLRNDLITHPKRGAINLHYSLLPEYRGVYPVNWAIIEGKRKTGVTFHYVVSKIDGGEIICQKEAPIYLSDTARTLQLRLDDLAYELLDPLLDTLFDKRGEAGALVEQAALAESYRSHANFAETNELDLNRDVKIQYLLNLLRGKTFFSNSKNLYVTDPDTGKRIYISINMWTD